MRPVEPPPQLPIQVVVRKVGIAFTLACFATLGICAGTKMWSLVGTFLEGRRRKRIVHRNIGCDGCGAHPIKGVRYLCGNCRNYDLCEECEARADRSAIHDRTHLFIKIVDPLPLFTRFSGPVLPGVVYRGSKIPRTLLMSYPPALSTKLAFDEGDLRGLYAQWSLSCGLSGDNKVGITQSEFQAVFAAFPGSLLLDRFFYYFDANADGVIDFEEFAVAISSLVHNNRRLQHRLSFNMFNLGGTPEGVTPEEVVALVMSHLEVSQEVTEWILKGTRDVYYDKYDGGGTRPISALLGPSDPIRFNQAPRSGVTTTMLLREEAGASMADMLSTVSRYDDNQDGRLNQREWSSFFERAGVIPGILEHMKALL